jgi:hypothetical protein
MRDLVDVHYPDAACIRVVQDNLSIHKPGALYEAFAPAEARRILRPASNSTSPRSTPVGSIWSSARSACYSASVLAAASTIPKGSETRSQHGKRGGIKPEPASNGCSQQTKPAPNSAAPIQPPPKSQNHRDEPLVLLRHKRKRFVRLICRLQHGQRESFRTMATINLRRIVAIEFGI